MQKSKYLERANWKLGNREIYESLDKMERELAQRMDLVEVVGKFNKKVPVLLTPAMKAGIELLISTRDRCCVSESNPYVFAKSVDSYIMGADALNHVLKSVPNLKRPEHLQMPNMRKYLATVTQLFGLEEASLQEVARHMGHELSVHRQVYRLQDDVIELAKISKLLLAVESGKAHRFSGMSIDDIDLDEIPDVSFDDTPSSVQSQESSTGSDDEIPGAIHNKSISTVPSQARSTVPSQARSSTVPSQAGSSIVPSQAGSSTVPSQTGSSTVPSQAGSSTVSSQKRSTAEIALRQKRKRTVQVYQFLDSGDEDLPDVSDSDCEVERRKIKKKQKSGNEKRVWTSEEKELLAVLVSNSVRSGKPPVKEHVVKLKKGTALDHLPWLKVKHKVWAMAQAEMRKNKKITKELIKP